jgi:RNase P/RNase MRP subunit p30
MLTKIVFEQPLKLQSLLEDIQTSVHAIFVPILSINVIRLVL